MSRPVLLSAIGLAAAVIFPVLAPNYLVNIGMLDRKSTRLNSSHSSSEPAPTPRPSCR